MTDAEAIRWLHIYGIAGTQFPDSPPEITQAVKAIENLLIDVLDAIPDYTDGRNDELVARIETALGIEQGDDDDDE